MNKITTSQAIQESLNLIISLTVKIDTKFLIVTKCQYEEKEGNSETLTPVRGPPPRTRSADYLWTGHRATPTDHRPPPLTKGIKTINRYSGCGVSTRLIVTWKFRTFQLCNCNRPSVQAQALFISLHIAVSFVVVIKYLKDRESFTKPPGSGRPRNFCSFPSAIFFSHY